MKIGEQILSLGTLLSLVNACHHVCQCIQPPVFYITTLSAGKLCIEVTPASKVAWISEELCIGCGICVKVRMCSS